jgi:hypothetical protein
LLRSELAALVKTLDEWREEHVFKRRNGMRKHDRA